MTVMLNAAPEATLVGPLMTKCVAATGVTVMPASVAVRLGVELSVTVNDCLPAVFSVTLKLATPALAAVNV